MATRTVRLDTDAEATLADLRRRTDQSISEVIRRSLQAYARELDADIRMRPGEVYRKLGLPGEGGFAVAPASRAKEVIADVIRKRHEQ
ncbi:MAG: ribbon-helix-helix protein, CopG family [Gemmatimonadetes bacterium]|nr:ribbon-helix-helix protein, CopG family [Gemmatimonadota bacterium]MYA63995.1 ribbon-helix-helix protein, CopG family [Gemmatimonadota bacterium]MYB98496.1 ribbon-helix-helix protein, CopG family [Gemmatimonadota bacterium]MYH52673.1 ribbon-helix-helix protein, CopG family [Gemmatimonadota bacterium]